MWRNPSLPPPEPRPAPQETGQRLAALPRGQGEELRVSLDEFQGKAYVGLRVWALGGDGAWWPTRKGVSVRIREIRGVSEALARAYALTEGGEQAPAASRPARSPRARTPRPATRATEPHPTRQLPGLAEGPDNSFDEFGDPA